MRIMRNVAAALMAMGMMRGRGMQSTIIMLARRALSPLHLIIMELRARDRKSEAELMPSRKSRVNQRSSLMAGKRASPIAIAMAVRVAIRRGRLGIGAGLGGLGLELVFYAFDYV